MLPPFEIVIAAGRVIFPPSGVGRYDVVLEMATGAGDQALSLLRQGYDHMFANTDCLLLHAQVNASNTFTKQLALQIAGVVQEVSADPAVALYNWTIGNYYRANGLAVDDTLKETKRLQRASGVVPGVVGDTRCAVVDAASLRIVNMIVADARTAAVAGCLLVNVAVDASLDSSRYLWQPAAKSFAPDASLQAEMDAAWNAVDLGAY